MSTHWPGPWRIEMDSTGGTYIGSSVGTVAAMSRGGDDESDANAQLMAAAPDLFEALKNLRDLATVAGPRLSQYRAAIEAANAALAKATGAGL